MKTLPTLCLTLLVAAPAGAAGLAPLARRLSRGAAKAGVSLVAVLPFKAVGGGEDGRGRLLAEDVSGRMAGSRTLRLLERAALDEVLGELSLGQTGALERLGAPRTGRLAAAQAVVTGVYAAIGGKAEVHARLVRVEDGSVLASARAVVSLPRLDAASAIPEPGPIAAYEAAADALDFQGRGGDARRLRRAAATPPGVPARRPAPAPALAAVGPRSDWRDAPADECAAWRERSDSLQASVIALKARYWAGQASKPGFKTPREAPGASFFDPALKRRFLERMEDAALEDPKMTMTEIKTFLDADREAWTLRAHCGGRAS